jgi:hypothetical protein
MEKLIKELQRMTVLWESLWFNKISSIQNDVGRRLQKFSSEFKRLNNSNFTDSEIESSAKEKYSTLIFPILHSFDSLVTETLSSTPSSPYEKLFQDNYKDKIIEAIDLLKSPQDFSNAKKSFDKFLAVICLPSFKLNQIFIIYISFLDK